MTKLEYMKFHKECCQRMIKTTRVKNADYSGTGDDPFLNFKTVGFFNESWVLIGFLTRMLDKLSRFVSFIQRGILYVKDETVEDSLLDLANYCILACGYIRSLRANKKRAS